MAKSISHLTRIRVAAGILMLASLAAPAAAQSPQFGGKNRDFITRGASVSAQWPDGKPKQLWSRDLGDGYSGIVVDHGRLFTMYRAGEDEVVISLDAETGKTIWEFKYSSPAPKGVFHLFGHGPNATPLVDRTRVFTLGAYGHVHCLNKSDGKLLWSENAAHRLSTQPAGFAYSASPIMYKDRVLILLGSEGGEVAAGVLCYHYKTGTLLWAKHNYEPVYSSGIIINVGGQDQLVVVEPTSIVGMNPLSGESYWEFPFQNQQKCNCATPIWDPKSRMLFASSAYGKGSVGLRLRRDDGGGTEVKEVWTNKRVQIHHGSTVLVGSHIYGSSGSLGPAFITGINLLTGEIDFRQRGFAKANVIYGDGKLLVLDEEGQLAIAEATSEGFSPTAQAQVLEKTAWTAPTLVGNRLYLRDMKRIIALEIGPPPPPARRGRTTKSRERA